LLERKEIRTASTCNVPISLLTALSKLPPNYASIIDRLQNLMSPLPG